jgi:hypothetical protein
MGGGWPLPMRMQRCRLPPNITTLASKTLLLCTARKRNLVSTSFQAGSEQMVPLEMAAVGPITSPMVAPQVDATSYDASAGGFTAWGFVLAPLFFLTPPV